MANAITGETEKNIPGTNTQDQVGGATSGLTPQQVSSIGTSQQKQGAFKLMGLPSAESAARGTQPSKLELPKPEREKSLEWQKLTKQVTPSQQQLMNAKQLIETNEQLAGMGNIGTQIKGILQGQLDKLLWKPEGEEQLYGVTGEAVGAEKRQQAYDLVSKISTAATSEDKNEAIASLNTLLGKSPGELLTIDDITNMFPDKITAVSEAIAGGLADVINIDRNMLSEMGYETEDEIQGLLQTLGIPENELKNYTVQEFQDKVTDFLQTQQTQLAPVDALMAKLEDPYTSNAQKEIIREQLAELGASGALAAEATRTQLIDIIDKADEQLTIGDKTGTLAELLDDESISGMVTDYLLSDERGRKKSELPEGLKTLIEENEDFFQSITQDLDEDITGFKQLQSQFEDMGTGKALSLSGDFMKSLAEETLGIDLASTFLTKDMTNQLYEKFPGFKVIKDASLSESAETAYLNSINEFNKLGDTDAAKSLLKLSPDQIKSLAFDDPAGEHVDYLDSFETNKRIDATVEKLKTDTEMDPLEKIETLAKAIVPDMDISFFDLVESLEIAERAGDENAGKVLKELTNIFDTGGDLRQLTSGELDQIAANIKNQMAIYNSSLDSKDNFYKTIENYTKAKPGELPLASKNAIEGATTGKELFAAISGALGSLPAGSEISDLDKFAKAYPEYAGLVDKAKGYFNTTKKLVNYAEQPVYDASWTTGHLNLQIDSLKDEISGLEKIKSGAEDPDLVQKYIDTRKAQITEVEGVLDERKKAEDVARIETLLGGSVDWWGTLADTTESLDVRTNALFEMPGMKGKSEDEQLAILKELKTLAREPGIKSALQEVIDQLPTTFRVKKAETLMGGPITFWELLRNENTTKDQAYQEVIKMPAMQATTTLEEQDKILKDLQGIYKEDTYVTSDIQFVRERIAELIAERDKKEPVVEGGISDKEASTMSNEEKVNEVETLMGGPIDWNPMEIPNASREDIYRQLLKSPKFAATKDLNVRLNIVKRLKELFPEQSGILNKVIGFLNEAIAGGGTVTSGESKQPPPPSSGVDQEVVNSLQTTQNKFLEDAARIAAEQAERKRLEQIVLTPAGPIDPKYLPKQPQEPVHPLRRKYEDNMKWASYFGKPVIPFEEWLKDPANVIGI